MAGLYPAFEFSSRLFPNLPVSSLVIPILWPRMLPFGLARMATYPIMPTFFRRLLDEKTIIREPNVLRTWTCRKRDAQLQHATHPPLIGLSASNTSNKLFDQHHEASVSSHGQTAGHMKRQPATAAASDQHLRLRRGPRAERTVCARDGEVKGGAQRQVLPHAHGPRHPEHAAAKPRCPSTMVSLGVRTVRESRQAGEAGCPICAKICKVPEILFPPAIASRNSFDDETLVKIDMAFPMIMLAFERPGEGRTDELPDRYQLYIDTDSIGGGRRVTMFLRVRDVETESGSGACLVFAKSCLKRCLERHWACRGSASAPISPTRLVYVGSNNTEVKLVEPATGTVARFAALCYC
ncbi:hypothetical protein CDD83_8800 [Cordyceps sp. RAO-2017]|nr:hypothetical protein CDD83_8800 [Cordyceps sp. RAO-2017]